MSYHVDTETTSNNMPENSAASFSEENTANDLPSQLTWEILCKELCDKKSNSAFPILSLEFFSKYEEFFLAEVRKDQQRFENYSGSDYIKRGIARFFKLQENPESEIKWPSLAEITEKEENKNTAANAFKFLHTTGAGKSKKFTPAQTAPFILFKGKKTTLKDNVFVTVNPFYVPAENKSKIYTGTERQNTLLETFKDLLPETSDALEVAFSLSFERKNNRNAHLLPNALKAKEFKAKILLKIENNIGICILGNKTYRINNGIRVFIDREVSENPDSYIAIFNNSNAFKLLKRYNNNPYKMNNAAGEVKNISTYFFPADNANKFFEIKCDNEKIQKLIRKYWVKYDNQWVSFANLPTQETLTELMENPDYLDGLMGGFLAFCIFEAIISDFEKEQADSETPKWIPDLPSIRSLTPPRQVDLKPFDMRKKLEEKNLRLSSSVINSAAVALNSGNHIILTGSPGTGKTTFAQRLAEEAGCSYTMCTASPDWTTNELIGRYMPAVCKTDQLLEFQEGYFLQAIRNNQWLIIDELNRADIDSCMGGLFSVLSGHETILPFRVKVVSHGNEVKLADEENQADDAKIQYRRAGICHRKNYEKLCEQNDVYWYVVPDSFRIICTMNDADAGMLNQLSFALQRRFSIVRVESPEKTQIENIIINKINTEWDYYSSKSNQNESKKNLGRTMLPESKEWLIRIAKELFVPKNNGFDFLSSHVIGIGQVVDIIRITIEGISCSPEFKFDSADKEARMGLFKSVAANAVVMKILPQLSSYIHNQEDINNVFAPALKLLKTCFDGKEYLLTVEDNDPNRLLIKKQEKELGNYLLAELKMHFRNSHLDINDFWQEADPQ